jgi:hypothetical protein
VNATSPETMGQIVEARRTLDVLLPLVVKALDLYSVQARPGVAEIQGTLVHLAELDVLSQTLGLTSREWVDEETSNRYLARGGAYGGVEVLIIGVAHSESAATS